MARRQHLGCLAIATLVVCAWAGCDNGRAAKSSGLAKRCEQLGRVCGDKDKHDEKIIDECKRAAQQQAERGCTEQVSAVYDCFEKELCGTREAVWALDDLRVLADRHHKCVAERKASRECTEATSEQGSAR
jgi:hypothetical protein